GTAALRDTLAGITGRLRVVAELSVGIRESQIELQMIGRHRGELELDATAAYLGGIGQVNRVDRAARRENRIDALSLQVVDIRLIDGEAGGETVVEKTRLHAQLLAERDLGLDGPEDAERRDGWPFEAARDRAVDHQVLVRLPAQAAAPGPLAFCYGELAETGE